MSKIMMADWYTSGGPVDLALYPSDRYRAELQKLDRDRVKLFRQMAWALLLAALNLSALRWMESTGDAVLDDVLRWLFALTAILMLFMAGSLHGERWRVGMEQMRTFSRFLTAVGVESMLRQGRPVPPLVLFISDPQSEEEDDDEPSEPNESGDQPTKAADPPRDGPNGPTGYYCTR